ncbi:MAG: DUF2341 domain-containing protein, partial [Pseudomonadales bacterium]
SSTTNGDTVDDADIYITFSDGLLGTAATPDVTYTQGILADLTGNLLASDSTDTWWNSQWQSRTKITFDNTNSGVDLDDFPVLVSLTADDVDFAKIKAGGADIRFVDDDGMPLDYEIESWDDTVGSESANVWVKVQKINASVNTDYIHIYYNNSAASDAQNTAGVWDVNYAGVWHLNEATGATVIDSTSNSNDGTPEAGPAEESTGKIGGALDFDVVGPSTRIEIAADASLDLSFHDNWTMSAWVKPTSYTGTKWPTVFEYGIDATLGLATTEEATDGRLEHWSNDNDVEHSDSVATFNAWNHIAIVRDATTTTFYLNGVADGSGASTNITGGTPGGEAGGTIARTTNLSYYADTTLGG